MKGRLDHESVVKLSRKKKLADAGIANDRGSDKGVWEKGELGGEELEQILDLKVELEEEEDEVVEGKQDEEDRDDVEDQQDDRDVEEVAPPAIGGEQLHSVDDDDEEDEVVELEGGDGDDGDTDDDNEEDSNDDDADRAEADEEIGTEYLIRPIARPEDEEDASDFEPGEENDDDEEIEEDDDYADVATIGKEGTSAKRKRSPKEHVLNEDGSGEDATADDDGDEDPSLNR